MKARIVERRSRIIVVVLAVFVAVWIGVPSGAVGDDRPGTTVLRPQTQVGASRDEAEATIEELIGLIQRRLVLMHDVARAKWNTKALAEDPQREQILLQEVEKQGKCSWARTRIHACVLRGSDRGIQAHPECGFSPVGSRAAGAVCRCPRSETGPPAPDRRSECRLAQEPGESPPAPSRPRADRPQARPEDPDARGNRRQGSRHSDPTNHVERSRKVERPRRSPTAKTRALAHKVMLETLDDHPRTVRFRLRQPADGLWFMPEIR